MTEKKNNKTANQKLEEKLFYKKESAWTDFKDTEHKKIFDFADDYKSFLTESKTERLCVENIKKILEKNGFKNIENLKSIKKGDKGYRIFKGKTLTAFIAGDKKDEFLKTAPIPKKSKVSIPSASAKGFDNGDEGFKIVNKNSNKSDNNIQKNLEPVTPKIELESISGGGDEISEVRILSKDKAAKATPQSNTNSNSNCWIYIPLQTTKTALQSISSISPSSFSSR